MFEGPFKRVPDWAREVERDAQARGKTVDDLYFFYTTCPTAYDKNYVVAISKEGSLAP